MKIEFPHVIGMLRKILCIAYFRSKKRETKNHNNNNWSDDENDNCATCKKYTAKLPNNTDEKLCTACLFVKMRPQQVVERRLTQNDRLVILRKRGNERLKGKNKHIEKGDDVKM